MHFLDDSLLPENQEKLVIQVAPYGPQWIPADSDDIPVTIDQQIQKAVDCYNAGATVLHVHVREDDGKGSKRLSEVQRDARKTARSRAEDDPAGRRLDLVRPGKTMGPPPSGLPTTRATCWPNSIRVRTR